MIQGDAGNCRDVGEIGRAERSHAADVFVRYADLPGLTRELSANFRPMLAASLGFLIGWEERESWSRGVSVRQ